MTTFIKGDPDAPVPDDGTTVVYDGAKGAYVPGPVPGSGTSGTVTSVNGVEPDASGNVTIGNITIAAGAGIDVSYNPATDTYIISAAGGGSGGDETLVITNHGDGTVTYSGTSVVLSGDGSEFTINHPGVVVSGDSREFTATTTTA